MMTRSERAPMYWTRRVLVADDVSGTPVCVRAWRRGARVVWEPISSEGGAALDRSHWPIVAGLPVGVGLSAWLATPFRGDRKVRQVLPSVLDRQLPFPLEDCAYAFGGVWPGSQAGLPVAGSGSAALAVVGRNQDVENLGVGSMQPDAFGHEGVVLWSGLASVSADTMRALVWCRSSSLVLVLGAGNIYWSSHSLPGGDWAAVQRVLRLQRQTVAKGAYKDASVSWHIGGDEAFVRVFRGALEASEPSSASHVHMLPDGCHYLARLMAAHVLLPGQWRVPLLFSRAGEARRDRVLRRRGIATIVLSLVCGILLASVLQVRRTITERNLQMRERAVQEMVTSITGFPVAARGRDAVLIAERELAALQARVGSVVRGADFGGLAGALAAAVASEGGRIERLTLEGGAAYLRFWLPVGRTPDAIVAVLREHGHARVAVKRESDTGGGESDLQFVQFFLETLK